MAKDLSLPLRRALVSALRADNDVAGFVGERVYAADTPSGAALIWPFVQVGLIAADPYEANTFVGTEAGFVVSGYSNASDEGEAYRLGEAIRAALDETAPALENGGFTFRMDWEGSTTITEGLRYRALVRFSAIVGVGPS